ncbi:hypothetical protein GCM10027360_92090 [Amycolatopsis echigonensis]
MPRQLDDPAAAARRSRYETNPPLLLGEPTVGTAPSQLRGPTPTNHSPAGATRRHTATATPQPHPDQPLARRGNSANARPPHLGDPARRTARGAATRLSAPKHPPAAAQAVGKVSVTGMPFFNVRLTVHSRSIARSTAPARSAR